MHKKEHKVNLQAMRSEIFTSDIIIFYHSQMVENNSSALLLCNSFYKTCQIEREATHFRWETLLDLSRNTNLAHCILGNLKKLRVGETPFKIILRFL